MSDSLEKKTLRENFEDNENDEKLPEEGGFNDYLASYLSCVPHAITNFWQRIFTFADRRDWSLNGLSLLCSIASGAVLPLMTIVFGQFTTIFTDFASGSSTPDEFRSHVNSFTLWFIYLFIGKAVLSYFAAISISVSAIRTTRTIRQAFLEHILRMEIWYFDSPGNGSPATQVTTNATRINQGIADKLSLTVQAISMFFSAFIIAIAVQWKLALITMSLIPVILIVSGICVGIDAVLESRIVRLYSQGAAMAQEALSTVKTVHAFWAQKSMVSKYNEYLEDAHREGKKKSLNYGILYSIEYFVVYSATALAFWQGYRMFQSGEVPGIGKIFTFVNFLDWLDQMLTDHIGWFSLSSLHQCRFPCWHHR